MPIATGRQGVCTTRSAKLEKVDLTFTQKSKLYSSNK